MPLLFSARARWRLDDDIVHRTQTALLGRLKLAHLLHRDIEPVLLRVPLEDMDSLCVNGHHIAGGHEAIRKDVIPPAVPPGGAPPAIHDDQLRLPAQVEVSLYRITQEALNNVMKHAQASQLWVLLVVNSERLALEVRDDGRGFDMDATASGAGLGLQSMAERAEQIGAELSLKSVLGQGTSVLLELPYG